MTIFFFSEIEQSLILRGNREAVNDRLQNINECHLLCINVDVHMCYSLKRHRVFLGEEAGKDAKPE